MFLLNCNLLKTRAVLFFCVPLLNWILWIQFCLLVLLFPGRIFVYLAMRIWIPFGIILIYFLCGAFVFSERNGEKWIFEFPFPESKWRTPGRWAEWPRFAEVRWNCGIWEIFRSGVFSVAIYNFYLFIWHVPNICFCFFYSDVMVANFDCDFE